MRVFCSSIEEGGQNTQGKASATAGRRIPPRAIPSHLDSFQLRTPGRNDWRGSANAPPRPAQAAAAPRRGKASPDTVANVDVLTQEAIGGSQGNVGIGGTCDAPPPAAAPPSPPRPIPCRELANAAGAAADTRTREALEARLPCTTAIEYCSSLAHCARWRIRHSPPHTNKL